MTEPEAFLTCPEARSTPRAIGRSKRPPSFGRSAGARFTVMRPAGNSNCELRSAARTRSLASRTTMAGRPTIENVGNPLARLTSTCTSGALRPTCARQATRAKAMTSVLGLGCAFHGREPRLECFEPRTRALEHPGLRVELIARDQVELTQALAQDRTEARLEILLHGA